ncbi:hypothetical protein [Nocardia sp. NPDC051750]|uniref:hypothetical protein n=1 Tax=Nocardia sp. NPDC051750 TaxID=3364325 RepID=UPI00378D13AD
MERRSKLHGTAFQPCGGEHHDSDTDHDHRGGPRRPHPRPRTPGIDFTDAATATARIAAEFAGWAPELTALITDAETAPVPRMIHSLPDGHRWDHTPGVTLLGDAAHLTPPT